MKKKASARDGGGRGCRGTVGAIESFGCGPSQSAAGWSFAQAGGAYNWLFVAVGGANMCKCLFLVEARRKDYDAEQPRVPAFFFLFFLWLRRNEKCLRPSVEGNHFVWLSFNNDI